jgi:cytochrome bd-type quinol oxidase subunit 2
MDTPQIQSRIKELQYEVSPYSKKKITSSTTFSFPLSMSSYKTYALIPVVVLVLLLILRPKFLYNDKPNGKEKTFSFQKLLLSWIVISFLLVMGLFGYNYTRKD